MKFFRTWLVWLMLLAIPLQGFAAASSLLCDAASKPVASHIAANMVEGHCDTPDDAVPDSATLDDAVPDDAEPGSPAKCSNCASCCVGMAIAPAFAVLLEPRPLASEPIAYAAMHATAHIPGGLERPPHSPIA